MGELRYVGCNSQVFDIVVAIRFCIAYLNPISYKSCMTHFYDI